MTLLRGRGRPSSTGAPAWGAWRAAAFLCAACLIVGAHAAWAGINVWTSNGPGETVLALAIDPTTSTTLYAGADGGVFKSTDGGETWSISLPGYASGLVIESRSPTTLYAVTRNGLFKTHDAGTTWSAIGPNGTVRALAIDPAVSTTLYAGVIDDCPQGVCHGGVFKSTDGGNTWNATGLIEPLVSTLVIAPTTPATLYAGTSGSGVFKSTDGGATWTAIGPTPTDVNALTIDPATPTTLYFAGGGCPDRCQFGIFKITNGGSTWSFLGPDEGASALAIDPTNPSTLYAANSGGAYKSSDGGSTWSAIGPNVNYVSALAIDPARPTTLYVGSFGGVFKSTTGGGTWSATGFGPSTTNVSALAIDLATPATLYAGSNPSIFKSTDGGGSWIALNTALDTGIATPAVSALVVDPASPTTLYAATRNVGVFKSTDSGSTWGALNAGLTNTDVRALVINPKTPARLYAGTNGGGVFSIEQVNACLGDCDASGSVAVNEIITLVNIALGTAPPAACSDGGLPIGGEVTVAVVIQAVNNALNGCGGNPPRSETCTQQDQAVQAAVDATRHSPNAIVAVKNEACGVSLYASGNPADATTASLFLLGSVTKTFVATSVLSLVKEGKLGLDDPIKNWIAGLGAKYDPVTVRMLLKHTSGIFNYTDDSRLYTDRNRVWQPRELVDLALTHNPYFAPGAGFHYCNTNYILLGMVLEAVTGQKLGSVLHQHAIDRAGLKHTFFLPEEPIEGQMATQFYPSGQKITIPFDPSFVWAAGGMVASAADVVDWVWALYGSQTVLDPTQIREMTDDSVVAELLPDFAESRYGQGVIIGTFTGTNSGPGVGHSGRWDGTSTDAYYFKDIGTAAVVLQNVQFWPPKVGDETVLIGVLNALSP